MAKKKKGAMATSPSTQAKKSAAQSGLRRVSPGVYQNTKGERVNSRGQQIDVRGRVVRKEPAQAATPATPGAESQQPATPAQLTPEQQAGQGIYGGLNQQLGFLQSQGQFQPGDFGQQMQQAYGNVMQNFERTMGPQFAREQADFRQMAAERGLDPNSEAYRSLQQQVNQNQESQRQAAMSSAQTAAQGVQQQGFTQAATQYQMPGTMMGAFAPFYGEMGQQQRFGQELTWEQQKLGQQGQQALEQLRLQGQINRSMPRGDPNALTFAQRMEMLDREMTNRAAIQGNQPPQKEQSTGNAFVSGAASGVGSSIMGG
jgi:hypothetical protein